MPSRDNYPMLACLLLIEVVHRECLMGPQRSRGHESSGCTPCGQILRTIAEVSGT